MLSDLYKSSFLFFNIKALLCYRWQSISLSFELYKVALCESLLSPSRQLIQFENRYHKNCFDLFCFMYNTIKMVDIENLLHTRTHELLTLLNKSIIYNTRRRRRKWFILEQRLKHTKDQQAPYTNNLRIICW
jgi:hypothetical protein